MGEEVEDDPIFSVLHLTKVLKLQVQVSPPVNFQLLIGFRDFEVIWALPPKSLEEEKGEQQTKIQRKGV